MATTGSAPVEARGIEAWLDTFACYVREENYEAASALFADRVVAFGTVSDAMNGLSELIGCQWERVWSNTRGFHFFTEQLTYETVDGLAWIAVGWTSQVKGEDGIWRERPGRATFVLKKEDGRWLAIHSHLSLNPSYLRAQPETAGKVVFSGSR